MYLGTTPPEIIACSIPLIATDTTTYPNPLELGKLPNGVADTVEMGSDGRWKVVRRVGKTVLDGSQTVTGTDAYSIIIADKKATLDVLCSHFPFASAGAINSNTVRGNTSNNSVTFYANTATWATATAFKAFLAGISLAYELATPVIIDLSDATQAALNTMYNSPMPTTLNMWTENAVHPGITIDYSKDINVAFAQMQAAILALGGT